MVYVLFLYIAVVFTWERLQRPSLQRGYLSTEAEPRYRAVRPLAIGP